MKKRKTRQFFISFFLAFMMMFTVFFNEYTTIKSEAASKLSISTANFRKISTISRNKTYRVTTKGGYSYVKMRAPKSGKYTVIIKDIRYGKSANNPLSMCVQIYRYKSNTLRPVTFGSSSDTWLCTKGYKKKYGGGYTSCELTLRMDKGQYIVVRTNALTHSMYNYQIRIK